MPIYQITAEQLKTYRQHLFRVERSPATIHNYIRQCSEFLRYCQAAPCLAFAQASPLQGWKQALVAADLSPATINAKLAAVNGLLRFLGHPECCVRQVRRQRRVFRDRGRDLSKSEYLRLVRTATPLLLSAFFPIQA